MRILQAAVIIMAVLIFVGLGVLVWGLFNLNSKDGGAPTVTAGASPGAPKALDRISLGLPPGCDIAGANAAEGRLIVRTSCGELRILDLGTLRMLGIVER